MKGRGENFWQEVRRAYENGEGSYQTLADRFGVSRGAMASHGRAEGWNRKKQEATDLQEMTGKLSRAAMREIGRLETSLKSAGTRTKLVFLHYPPKYLGYECPELLALLDAYEVPMCCYGHIHSKGCAYAFQGMYHHTEMRLLSADYLNFCPRKILD